MFDMGMWQKGGSYEKDFAIMGSVSDNHYVSITLDGGEFCKRPGGADGVFSSVLYCEPDLRRDCRRGCRKKYKESVVSASRDISIIPDWHRGVF